ncbi:hypothetical protein AWC38_SpisGene19965 [Stylophora pistillata]|uniref:HAT C-terminal dimerisation domain-containing protein n=1 Tax=Stylophora pistillata TaxID=50429 RepID=A0A2B4RF48_STYPI|nr:hypothetical protein AWC38_SpisGene19965 [Stylophora pistillata]
MFFTAPRAALYSVITCVMCFTLHEIVATDETAEKSGFEDAPAAEILPERQERSSENNTNQAQSLNNVHQRLQAVEKKLEALLKPKYGDSWFSSYFFVWPVVTVVIFSGRDGRNNGRGIVGPPGRPGKGEGFKIPMEGFFITRSTTTESASKENDLFIVLLLTNSRSRGSMLIMPARNDCPSGWTEEYHGYLMTEFYNHKKQRDYICVDEDAEARPGTGANKDGALLYLVEASDLARKRKVQCTLPKHGKRFHPPKSKSNPKDVTASATVTEFPGENLTVSKSNGQLFCNACHKEIGLKKTIIENHVKSSKHASGKERLEKKEARERDIAKSLEEYDNQFIRRLPEEEAFSLTSSRHLSDFIDVIAKDERKKVKEEIKGRDDILNDQQKLALLKVELAITVDAMKPFVQSTYQLEGNGSLCLQAYQIVRKSEAKMRNLHFPNCSPVIRNIANGNIALQRQSEAYAMACIQPAYDYFTSKFLNNGDQLQPAVEIFKAARLFNPNKIAEIQPTAAILSDQLRKVPFLNNDACIDGLQRELPTYIAAATDVNPDINVLTWWEIHEQEIPNWTKACKKILLIQPSSAASEVFSLLENSFPDNQACALEDYIEASSMLQCNQR